MPRDDLFPVDAERGRRNTLLLLTHLQRLLVEATEYVAALPGTDGQLAEVDVAHHGHVWFSQGEDVDVYMPAVNAMVRAAGSPGAFLEAYSRESGCRSG